MSQKKHKKRHVQSTVAAKKRAAAEELADQKDRARKRMNPVTRNLLFSDLIFLGVCELLTQSGMLSPLMSGIATVVGVFLLILALWFQFGQGPGRGSDKHSPLG